MHPRTFPSEASCGGAWQALPHEVKTGPLCGKIGRRVRVSRDPPFPPLRLLHAWQARPHALRCIKPGHSLAIIAQYGGLFTQRLGRYGRLSSPILEGLPIGGFEPPPRALNSSRSPSELNRHFSRCLNPRRVGVSCFVSLFNSGSGSLRLEPFSASARSRFRAVKAGKNKRGRILGLRLARAVLVAPFKKRLRR